MSAEFRRRCPEFECPMYPTETRCPRCLQADRPGDTFRSTVDAFGRLVEPCIRDLVERNERLWLDVLNERRLLAEAEMRFDIAYGLLDDHGLRKDYQQALDEALAEARGQAMEP